MQGPRGSESRICRVPERPNRENAGSQSVRIERMQGPRASESRECRVPERLSPENAESRVSPSSSVVLQLIPVLLHTESSFSCISHHTFVLLPNILQHVFCFYTRFLPYHIMHLIKATMMLSWTQEAIPSIVSVKATRVFSWTQEAMRSIVSI